MFQRNAFQNSGFQTQILSGGATGIKFNDQAFAEAYLTVRKKHSEVIDKAPSKVVEKVREIARESVKNDLDQKEREARFRDAVRDANYRINLAWVRVLGSLVEQYQAEQAKMLDAERRKKADEEAILLLL